MSLALAGGNDASASLATIGLATLGPSGIVMDTAKAMSILGFSSSTTFEATSMDEINHAFMHKLHILLRPPRASNKKGNPRAMADRKGQMRKLNEALQFLIKKRTKSKATEDWRQNGKRTLAVAMALQAMDEQAAYLKSEDLKEQVLRDRADKEKASKQALALAEELVAAIESIDAENRGTLKKKKRDSTNDDKDQENEKADHSTPKKSTLTKKPPSSQTFEESDTPHTRKKSYKKRGADTSSKNHKNKSNKKNNEHVTTNLRKTEHTSSDPDLSGGYRYSINLSEVDEIQSNLLQFHLAQTDEMWPF